MKQYVNLFSKIIDPDNFKYAYYSAIEGKRHYREVKQIEKHPQEYIEALRQSVIDETYEVSEYEVFERFSGGKMRTISKLPMRDRIVQHAIMRVIEPLFRETFIIDTYSSIKERGMHRALYRIKKAINTDTPLYCLKLDIRKCYPSLDLDILKEKLAKKFLDQRLLRLLYKIIDSCPTGVPIGNYTSLYFNNFYFNDFDHWIKEVKQVKHYFRYCDDMVIIHEDKQFLHDLFKEIQVKIYDLHVQLKPNHQVLSVDKEGIDFVGYVIYKDHIRLRKRTKKKFVEKLTAMKENDEINMSVLGSYYGILKHGNCRNLWEKYTSDIQWNHLTYNHKLPIRYILHQEIEVLKLMVLPRKHPQLQIQYIYKDKKYVSYSLSKYLIKDAFKYIDKQQFPIKLKIDTYAYNQYGFSEPDKH